MDLGEIYVWDTDKAKGYDIRQKYHVYICEPDWQYEHTFLFVSKANYNGDYPIYHKDYPFLSLEVSYVGDCVFYSDAELTASKPRLLGKLTKAHLARAI